VGGETPTPSETPSKAPSVRPDTNTPEPTKTATATETQTPTPETEKVDFSEWDRADVELFGQRVELVLGVDNDILNDPVKKARMDQWFLNGKTHLEWNRNTESDILAKMMMVMELSFVEALAQNGQQMNVGEIAGQSEVMLNVALLNTGTMSTELKRIDIKKIKEVTFVGEYPNSPKLIFKIGDMGKMGVSLSEDGSSMKIYSEMNFNNETNEDIVAYYEQGKSATVSFYLAGIFCNMFTFPRIVVSSGISSQKFIEYRNWTTVVARNVGTPMDGYTADLAVEVGLITKEYNEVYPGSADIFWKRYWPVQIA
jgi:hypothetical protein